MTKQAKPSSDPLVTDAQLGEFLGVPDTEVRRLVRVGILPKEGVNQFALRRCVAAYCAHWRDKAHGKGDNATAIKLGAHKARLAKEQADSAEMDNALKRRELVPLRAIEREWSAVMLALRARLLAVPSRVQQRMGYLTQADVTGIDREIRDALTELGSGQEGLENPSEGL